MSTHSRRRAVILLLAAGASVVLLAVFEAARGSGERGKPRSGDGAAAVFAEAAAGLPPSSRPSFAPGRIQLLDPREMVARFAPVARATRVHAAPSSSSAVVANLDPRTSDGTTNIVLVDAIARRGAGRWVRVQLAELPNNRSGWVRRDVLGGYRFVRTRLVVDREQLRAVLYRDGRVVFRAPVGIGRASAPTPAGRFYVRDRLNGFGNPFYGPVAFGTSARSDVLTDWPDGGVIGIHGTNEPELIPGRISHGCIRLRNRDILRLSRLMPVGTPITIR